MRWAVSQGPFDFLFFHWLLVLRLGYRVSGLRRVQCQEGNQVASLIPEPQQHWKLRYEGMRIAHELNAQTRAIGAAGMGLSIL